LKPNYDQLGPVYNGPGSLHDRKPFTLATLDFEQRGAIDRAKKYAMEESIKAALAKQTRQQQLLQTPANKKAQTLNLLSRIYVGSISYDLKEESIKVAFSPFGPIRSVTMSWDAATQKHKGFAFIEFEHPEAAHLAVEQMNNASLGGRQLKVGRPSNLPQADPLITELVTEYKLEKKIYIAGVHADLTEEDLKLVFEAFGKITSCKLPPDPHRGFGYIEYESEQSANDAVASMNMFDLGGQFLRVGKAISPPEDQLNAPSSSIPSAAAMAAASVFLMLPYPGTLSWDRIEAQEAAAKAAEMGIEEDDGLLEHQENFHIRGRDARNVIMQKLIRPPPRGVMILRNMVGPEDCDDDLEAEVQEECCNYGPVERVVIYQELDEEGQLIIKIFVVFTEFEAVDRAIASLNGRYFAGRQVVAERYDTEKFTSNDLTG
uniref:Poly(U)-binding-splicing factor PUF60 n=1 Tax=Echinostoma caproni TaxID=27848 RepID=A0A183B3I2_9TREM